MIALRNLLLLFCLVTWIVACEEVPSEPSTSNPTTTLPTPAETSPPNEAKPELGITPTDNAKSNTLTADPKTTTSHACEIKDVYLDKNVFLAKDAQQLIAIVATADTKDAKMGDSHRTLQIYNSNDCSLIFSKTLPVNRSPDFPYYLIPTTYESQNQIIGIQGFNTLYFYDVENKKLSAPLEPEFISDREVVDAQSGMIRGLTVWRKNLLGHSIDFGPFAFNLKDKSNPKAEKAVAEYPIPKTAEFRYLFLLEDANNRYMPILPVTDIDAGGNLFEIQKMFPQAIVTEPRLPKNIQNNRYLVINDNTDPRQVKRMVVDMYGQRWVPLPPDVSLKKASEILEWVKANKISR